MFSDDSDSEKLRYAESGRYSVQVMQEPYDKAGVVVRKNYLDPFWHIERSAKRWERPTSLLAFDEADQPRVRATRFADQWREYLFPTGPEIPKSSFVYVPLQGRLLIQRSFQSCSPIQMVEAILAHEPTLPIIVTLHPGEKYSEEELAAVDRLVRMNKRVSQFTGRMSELLPHCSYVVTQNSSAGLLGYFLHKPLILFGKIDFHHIAANVSQIGEIAAFK